MGAGCASRPDTSSTPSLESPSVIPAPAVPPSQPPLATTPLALDAPAKPTTRAEPSVNCARIEEFVRMYCTLGGAVVKQLPAPHEFCSIGTPKMDSQGIRTLLAMGGGPWLDEIGVTAFENRTYIPPTYRTLGVERVPSWSVDAVGDAAILTPYPPERLTPRRDLLDQEGFRLTVRRGDRVYDFTRANMDGVSPVCALDDVVRIAREFLGG